MASLPTQAQVVVIGGGIIGCSTAYHLARDHKADVLLVERGKLTNGSSWHAAGLVGQLRSSATVTRLLKYSVELYAKLEAETGLATGWKQNGGLRLACNTERWIEVKRQATTAHSFGLDMHLLTPEEAQKLWPIMTIDDLVGAAFLPTDGQANPADITQSLAKGARMHGARIAEGVRVTGFDIRDGRVAGVRTSVGDIACERVVLCSGLWSREIGRLAGINVPLQPMQHQYIVTERIDGVPANLPTLRDPDRLTYYKEEVGGLVMGGYEPNPKPWALDGVPDPFEFQLLDEDWDHFEPTMRLALGRVPLLSTAGIKQMINGPESFTPDGMFMLGEAPEVQGFFIGTGFNAFGIASAGGAGWALASWVMSGEQPMDLWVADIRRFSGLHGDDGFVRERTTEAYGKHYTIVWPQEEYTSARPRIVSPLYERLRAERAVFGSKLGWERPNWFARREDETRDLYSMGRQNWFDAVGEEHRAVREAAGLFDQSSFAKFEFRGADSERALSFIAANDVTRPPGRVTYTQMLNSRGGIECDLTLARLADDHFYIVTGTGFRTHDFAWIAAHIGANLDARLLDVTEDWGTLSLMGPRARDILAKATEADVSNAAFPFGHVRIIGIAGASVRAIRITYVGELGYELHAPIGAIGDIYDALMIAGRPLGLRPTGYRALETLRLEKGYRAWGSDITPNDNPFEAGLGWAVKLKQGTDFLGRGAIEKAVNSQLPKRLMCFTVADPSVVLTGRETILRNGQPVGYLTSGGWGYTVGKSIGYGYVRHAEGVTDDFLRAGKYSLEVASEIVPAEIHFAPLLDPEMRRIKA
ncbi:MAG: FAD-dependent oxidoreductase [Hyphomicrobiaceae bacterium]